MRLALILFLTAAALLGTGNGQGDVTTESVSTPTSGTTEGQSATPTTPGPECPRECLLEAERGGRGKAKALRWYFDSGTGLCTSFRYTGRKGNANKFLRREDCVERCEGVGACGRGRGVGGATPHSKEEEEEDGVSEEE